MKRKIVFAIVLFITVFSYSQRTQRKRICAVLKVKEKEKELGLSELDIQVEIVGNIATTTYDMLFYNPTNSILEGELSFPLGEGHQVSRFALDIKGKLREAVIVEKELGRIAFEGTVRRGVDPALLEKGTGNNYKARIYPIPAKGYKRIVLAYEQELIFKNNAHSYYLPLHFDNKLSSFKLNISVFDQKYKPVITEKGISNLEFSNWNHNYTLKVVKEGFIANKSLTIQIPLSKNTEKIFVDDTYFYVYKTVQPKKRLRVKPHKIAIYWDASLSMQQRDLKKEFAFLNQYFTHFRDLEVKLLVFSNTIDAVQEFSVKNGNWNALKDKIEQVTYDGGTNYKALSKYKIDVDAGLVFTDGMASLSDVVIASKAPVFLINGMVKSNHQALKNIAISTTGSYINLLTNTTKEALDKIRYQSYTFLGYEASNEKLEMYPKAPKMISNDFSFSGNFFAAAETLVLKFGYGNEVLERIPIRINADKAIHSDVKRIWAQKKVDFLGISDKKSKKEITNLGKDYGLVTAYTSLIILDDVRDYVRYQITPPKELLKEYNEYISAQEDVKKNRKSFSSSRRLRFAEGLSIDDEETEVDEMPLQMNRSIAPVYEQIDEIVEVVEEEVIEDVPFVIIEDAPTYPGCSGSKEELKRCFAKKIRQHFNQHFNIEVANNLNISNRTQRIYAKFTIDKQGNVTRIKVRAMHRKLEEEVVRVLQLLPKINPGKQRGRPVSVKYTLPIIISVEGVGQLSNNRRKQRHIELEPYTISLEDKAPKFKKYRGSLEVKERLVETAYLNELNTAKDVEETYRIYLKQRKKYSTIPAYYIDVSNFFREKYTNEAYASKIASNIAEMDFDNYELLRVFTYQLQQNNKNELAQFISKRVLELRPEDSQSYRDLALLYEANGKCQEALDLYNSIISGAIYENNSHRRVFNGIKEIAKNEMSHLIQKYKDDLNLRKIDKELVAIDSNLDLRVTVDWNHNDTDIDLHIIDPMLEECYFKHSSTIIGGKLSEDMTQGFGPEEFVLKNAIKGTYYIKIKYYGDSYQKVENPTFMKVNIFKKYRSKEEIKETIIIRLTKADNEEMIASITF